MLSPAEELRAHRALPIVLRDVHRKATLESLGRVRSMEFSEWDPDTVNCLSIFFSDSVHMVPILGHVDFADRSVHDAQIVDFTSFYLFRSRVIMSSPFITDLKSKYGENIDEESGHLADQVDWPEKIIQIMGVSPVREAGKFAQVYVMPDSPPVAVRAAHLDQVMDHATSARRITQPPSRTIELVRSQFGDEAIEPLSGAATLAIIAALQTTEASVPDLDFSDFELL